MEPKVLSASAAKYLLMIKNYLLAALCLGPVCLAQSGKDSLGVREMEEIVFIKKIPVTKEIVNVKKDLALRNLGQDLPVLLDAQTSVVSTSDAGNGVGYTGLRIRGVDGSRINVMLNGVPYNDSESQGTFFVDVPDVTSSASQVLIQRGVGTSSNGVAAFGASINLLMQKPSDKAYFSTDQSYGSFNTRKHAFEAGTGALLNGRLRIMGRYSIIKSDGYIERAFSDLKSYNVAADFKDNNTELSLLAFGGKEKTYQAWNGISAEQMAENRRYNPAGAIYSADWSKVVGFYDNETDNYDQNHYHLSWKQRFSPAVKLSTTFHYTKGNGYYENFKQDQKLSKYGLTPIVIGTETIKRMDLIRRKWLENDFYGVVSELSVRSGKTLVDLGFVANQYFGRHFGQVANGNYQFPVTDIHEYYRNNAMKNELSGYAKALWSLGNVELFGDLQVRNINYKAYTLHATPAEQADFDLNYFFFNPKAGLNINLPNGKFYMSYAQANREPKRSDIIDSKNTVKPEQLHDIEAGIQQSVSVFTFNANFYYMKYNNQLVLNGKLNDVGDALHENVKDSYRMGVELSANARLNEVLSAFANAAYSKNKISNYQYYNTFDKSTKDLGTTDIAFSPNLIASAGLNLKPAAGWDFSIIGKYVGEQYMDNTQSADRKLDAYFLTNVMAGYVLKLNGAELGLQLLVNNLFNKMYVSNGYVYNDPDWVQKETPYYFPQAGRNFMFGASLRF